MDRPVVDKLRDQISEQLDGVERLCRSIKPQGDKEAETAQLILAQCAGLRPAIKRLDAHSLFAVREALDLMARLYNGAAKHHWRPMKVTLEEWQKKRRAGGKKSAANRNASADAEKARLQPIWDRLIAEGRGPEQARQILVRSHGASCTRTLLNWGFKLKTPETK